MRTSAKWLGILLAIMLIAAGCQSGGSTTNGGSNSGGTADNGVKQGNENKGETPENVTLRFSWWGSENRHTALIAAIDLYMEQNPHVTIEPEYSGFDGYYQRLVTQFAGGTAPDLTPLSVDWIDELAVKGDLVHNLYDFEQYIELDKFDREFLEKYTVFDGKLVGLPMGLNGMALAYNKDFLERFNIPEDTVWDWDTLLEVGARVNKEDPDAYLLGMLDYRGFLMPYVNQMTGNQFIQDDYTLGFEVEHLEQAFVYFKQLLDEGALMPLAESSLYPDITESPEWSEGNIGMIFNLASTVERMKSYVPNLGVTGYPVPDDALTSAVLVNPANPLAINKASKHPEEAAKFANWLLTNTDSARILGGVYSVPPVEENRQTISEEGLIDPLTVQAVDYAMANPGEPVNGISGNQEILQLSEDMMDAVGFGQTEPRRAAEELIRRIEDIVAEAR